MCIIFLLRLIEIKWLNAVDYGITMNARGGPGIVLASLAYASGVISQEVFVTIVLTSVLTLSLIHI